jgi:hypothetical protein
MPPSSRKRSSAFDDFPVEQSQADSAMSTLPADPKPIKMVNLGTVSQPPRVERIERLKPSQMIPDRFQPRRLLPSVLRADFFSGRMTCYQAAERWLEMAARDQASGDEIDRLLSMGGSFEEHGQIKPVTGSWTQGIGGAFIFQIETGERRFWAACLRRVSGKLPDEPLLRVEVVEKPTRQRQVLENRHAETPSAVAQACEVAALILAERGLLPDPAAGDEFDYFRQARDGRMPPGLWDKLTPVMQLTRPRMVQLLNILQMPTPLLEKADRYRLPERVLREVLVLPPAQWGSMLDMGIQASLTSEEICELTGHTPPKEGDGKGRRPPRIPEPAAVAASGLKRFSASLAPLEPGERLRAVDALADTLALRRGSEVLPGLLEEVAAALRARLARK